MACLPASRRVDEREWGKGGGDIFTISPVPVIFIFNGAVLTLASASIFTSAICSSGTRKLYTTALPSASISASALSEYVTPAASVLVSKMLPRLGSPLTVAFRSSYTVCAAVLYAYGAVDAA